MRESLAFSFQWININLCFISNIQHNKLVSWDPFLNGCRHALGCSPWSPCLNIALFLPCKQIVRRNLGQNPFQGRRASRRWKSFRRLILRNLVVIEKVVARRRFDAARSNPPTSFPKGKNKKHFLRVKSLRAWVFF